MDRNRVLRRLLGSRASLKGDTDAALNMSLPLTILTVVITAVVGIAILAALFPTYLGSVADIVGAFNDPAATTNDTTADTLLPIFGLLVAFGGLFAIVGLVLMVVRINRKG